MIWINSLFVETSFGLFFLLGDFFYWVIFFILEFVQSFLGISTDYIPSLFLFFLSLLKLCISTALFFLIGVLI